MAEAINNFDKKRVFTKLESIEELPMLPQVMVMIRNISESPKSSAADLANVILKDPSLTSKVLRVANSSMYTGYSRKISSVTQAVVLMGFQAVRSIAFGVMVHSMLKIIKKNPDFDFQGFWLQSVKTAVAARMLSVLLGNEVPEEAFVAGFICDLGQLIIGQYFPEAYIKIEENTKHWSERIDVETRVLKVNHQEIGELLGEKWKFPKQLVEAIAKHHHPALPSKTQIPVDLPEIVYVANWIANIPSEKKERVEHVKKTKHFADIYLNLTSQRMDMLLQRFPDQITHAFKGLNIGEDDDDMGFGEELAETAAKPTKVPAKVLSAKLNSVQNQMAVLYEITSALTEAEDQFEVYHLGLEGIFRAMGFERIILFLMNQETTTLEGYFGFGVRDQKEVRRLKFPVSRGEGVFGKAVEQLRIFNVTDVKSKDYQDIISGREMAGLKTSSFAVIPIRVFKLAKGLIFADNQASRKPITDEEVRTLDLFVKQIELALGRFRDDDTPTVIQP